MIDCPWCAEVVRRRAELLSIWAEVFLSFPDEVIMEAMVAEKVELPCLCYELAEMEQEAADQLVADLALATGQEHIVQHLKDGGQ